MAEQSLHCLMLQEEPSAFFGDQLAIRQEIYPWKMQPQKEAVANLKRERDPSAFLAPQESE